MSNEHRAMSREGNRRAASLRYSASRAKVAFARQVAASCTTVTEITRDDQGEQADGADDFRPILSAHETEPSSPSRCTGSGVVSVCAAAAIAAGVNVNLPRLDTEAVHNMRRPAALIGFIVWAVSGVFWVDALRSSMRAIWHLPQYPGTFIRRQLINLAVLAGIGLLLAVSLALAAGAQNLLGWLLFDLAHVGSTGRLAMSAAGFAIGLATNTVLSVAVLSGLPRLRIPIRRVLGPALLIAAGVQILTSAGRLYVKATQANPAYQLVATAVGLLVFLNALNQLILFGAALAATGTTGEVTDLAQRPNLIPRLAYLRRVRTHRLHQRTRLAGPPSQRSTA